MFSVLWHVLNNPAVFAWSLY